MPGFYRLLLVEDNCDDVFLFMRAVARSLPNFQVSVAGDGDEAKEHLLRGEASQTDLVVTDLKMPRWNGFDLVRWLRRHPPLQKLPVCILSSSLEPRDVDTGYAAGANLYLVKPSNFRDYTDLMEVIRLFWEHPNRIPSSPLVRQPNGLRLVNA